MENQTNTVEKLLCSLVSLQTEFTSKALKLIALGVKNIYSTEEAALFLDLEVKYLYQLRHQNKLRAYKGQNMKKIYFRRKDLESYLLSGSQKEDDHSDYDKLEKEIEARWKK